ncbi:ribonuclease H-like domain-containing protein [Mycena crocata]|nr:ribonuclease H-like domain-containing protein [Mycena crocata]
MAPGKSPLWDHFYRGAKKNSSHYHAYCLGCLLVHRPATNGEPIDVDEEPTAALENDWIPAALPHVQSVLGEKKAMIAHLIGATSCPNASANAKSVARKLRGKDKGIAAEEQATDGDDESDGAVRPARKRKRVEAVERSFKQSKLQVFKGIDIPFPQSQMEIIQTQFLRATISANLPFRWVINPEVITLFLMFRSAAGTVIPDRKALSGRLLTKESRRVAMNVGAILKGRYVVVSTDGWKDKFSVTGVDASVDGKSYLIDVIHSNGKRKDGESMCTAFCGMIDKAEKEHGCIVVALCCDNDGGSRSGRNLTIIKRPWLFGPPCCAHQGQLVLVDYFKENPEAAETAEQTVECLGWIVSHEHVRDIFDKTQVEKNGAAIAYLIANITRWTTHSLSFNRLIRLQSPMRTAVISKRAEIIAAQVGAEKNKKNVKKITNMANKFCDLLDDPNYWQRLKTVAADIEPICYITNINQGDSTRADQVLLGLAGVYLHFKRHPDRRLAAAMMKRIEKRWAALDQPMFVFCLILNPYELLERFGPSAGANVFTLVPALVDLYRRVNSRPPAEPLTEAEQAMHEQEKLEKEAQVSKAFMQYLSSTGEFKHWRENQTLFESINGNDPILVWKQFLLNPDISELADFAILLLGMSINQGGNERDFSDFKIKKSRLRNRLGFSKVGEMSQVGADIRASHMAAEGLFETREKRKNHDDDRVKDLIAVPRYADALESGSEDTDTNVPGKRRQVLVKTKRGWQKEFLKWVMASREAEAAEEEDPPQPAASGSRKWLPLPFSKLFGDDAPRPVDHRRIRRPTFDREQLLMELLAAEHSDEAPDDGELEGSGDDYSE